VVEKWLRGKESWTVNRIMVPRIRLKSIIDGH